MELGMKLNPNHPAWYAWFHGSSLYGAHRYQESAAALQAAAVHTVVSRLYLAAALHRLGKDDEARLALAAAQEEVPEITIAMLEQIEAYRDPAGQAHLSESLRSLGLPES
jgi:adenylate cyclase